jgi:hypothetical protein
VTSPAPIRDRTPRDTTLALPSAPADPWWAIACELVALTGLALTQPVLDVFGRAPEAFTDVAAHRADIIGFAILVALAPSCILLVGEAALRRVSARRLHRPIHLAILGILAYLVTVQVIKRGAGWTGGVLAVVSVVAAVTFVALCARFAGVRTWLRFAALGPLVFVALFLVASPTSDLLVGVSPDARTAVPAGDGARPPIVLIILDELPTRSLLAADGTVDARRFPGFGALAADSTWYRNMTAAATHTNYAVPAILTGRYAPEGNASVAAVLSGDNVFRLLGDGYRLNVAESKTKMCVVDRCNLANPENRPDPRYAAPEESRIAEAPSRPSPLAALLRRARSVVRFKISLTDTVTSPDADQSRLDGAALIDPSPSIRTSPTVPARPSPTSTSANGAGDTDGRPTTTTDEAPTVVKAPEAAARPAQFEGWLARIDADVGSPQFSVIHTVLPHSPWFLDGDGTRYATPPRDENLIGFEGIRWLDARGPVITARQRHLLMVRYTDTLITAVRDRLVELGVWDEAIVIITADHGAAFEPGGYFRRWEPANSPDVVGVPLFVHGRGFEPGRIVDEPTESVDIVATIADVSRITPPWPIDGVSLRALPATARTSHLYVKASDDEGDYRVELIAVGDHLERLLAGAPEASSATGDDLEVMRRGPRGDLIGTALDDVEIGATADGSARMRFPDAAPDQLAANDDGEVPALLLAEIDRVGPDELVVVTLDDRLAATGLTFLDRDGTTLLTVLIPPDWLREGTHRVAFYRLDPTSRDDRLLPLAMR